MKRGLPLMALHRLTLGLQKTARHPLSRLHARVRVVRARKVSGAAAVPPMQTNGGSRRFKYLCGSTDAPGVRFSFEPASKPAWGRQNAGLSWRTRRSLRGVAKGHCARNCTLSERPPCHVPVPLRERPLAEPPAEPAGVERAIAVRCAHGQLALQ